MNADESQAGAGSHPLTAEIQATSSASAELTTGRDPLRWAPNLEGGFDVARAQHEVKASSTAHRQREAEKDAEHRRIQEAADNNQRRRIVYWICGIVVATLIAGTWIAIAADNADTRRWAQSLVTVILSGILGAVGGYFSARSRR